MTGLFSQGFVNPALSVSNVFISSSSPLLATDGRSIIDRDENYGVRIQRSVLDLSVVENAKSDGRVNKTQPAPRYYSFVRTVTNCEHPSYSYRLTICSSKTHLSRKLQLPARMIVSSLREGMYDFRPITERQKGEREKNSACTGKISFVWSSQPIYQLSYLGRILFLRRRSKWILPSLARTITVPV